MRNLSLNEQFRFRFFTKRYSDISHYISITLIIIAIVNHTILSSIICIHNNKHKKKRHIGKWISIMNWIHSWRMHVCMIQRHLKFYFVTAFLNVFDALDGWNMDSITYLKFNAVAFEYLTNLSWWQIELKNMVDTSSTGHQMNSFGLQMNPAGL